MSYSNRLSVKVEDETIDSGISKVKDIRELFPFLLNLTPEEIRVMPKMGDGSLPFCDKTLEFAVQFPAFSPGYFNLEEMERDLTLAKQLKRLLNVLEPLTESIRDTYYAVGSEAFTAARTYYNSVKGAVNSNVPGSDTIAAELGKRYHYSKPTKPKPVDDSAKKEKEKSLEDSTE